MTEPLNGAWLRNNIATNPNLGIKLSDAKKALETNDAGKAVLANYKNIKSQDPTIEEGTLAQLINDQPGSVQIKTSKGNIVEVIDKEIMPEITPYTPPPDAQSPANPVAPAPKAQNNQTEAPKPETTGRKYSEKTFRKDAPEEIKTKGAAGTLNSEEAKNWATTTTKAGRDLLGISGNMDANDRQILVKQGMARKAGGESPVLAGDRAEGAKSKERPEGPSNAHEKKGTDNPKAETADHSQEHERGTSKADSASKSGGGFFRKLGRAILNTFTWPVRSLLDLFGMEKEADSLRVRPSGEKSGDDKPKGFLTKVANAALAPIRWIMKGTGAVIGGIAKLFSKETQTKINNAANEVRFGEHGEKSKPLAPAPETVPAPQPAPAPTPNAPTPGPAPQDAHLHAPVPAPAVQETTESMAEKDTNAAVAAKKAAGGAKATLPTAASAAVPKKVKTKTPTDTTTAKADAEAEKRARMIFYNTLLPPEELAQDAKK
ncbi:MAG: hypothetical protein WC527_01620 [Candidatus Margulisiibacteriota bacterium]